MTLDSDTIQLAYRLFLNRTASEAEVANMERAAPTLTAMRQLFLNSSEFMLSMRAAMRQSQTGPASTLIHLHIPKTAGTTLTQILGRVGGPGRSLTVGDYNMQELLDLPPAERRQLRFIFGHMSHGVARHLPQYSTYISVLRRPGPRILSYFHYVRRTTDHPSHEVLFSNRMGFGDFLEFAAATPGQRLEVDNGQIRRLSGRVTQVESIGQERELFDRALGNIFAPDMIYGLTEHFDDFLSRLRARGMIERSDSERMNASPERNDLDSELERLTDSQRTLFDEFTVWDDHFYSICEAAYFGPLSIPGGQAEEGGATDAAGLAPSGT